MKIKRAVVSVTDKRDVDFFANVISAKHGVEIISTGGTATLLRGANCPVVEVSEYTGFPEMLGGRVKTLHPKVAAGILARRDNVEDMAALRAHDIPPIDMVVVNLYQFSKVAAKPGVTLDEMIENIDIGGPTMIRAAAKNWQGVAVVTDPGDYAKVLKEMASTDGYLSKDTLWHLAQKAFRLTGDYDTTIRCTLDLLDCTGQRLGTAAAAQ